MPKATTYTLIWSDDAGTYELRYQDGRSPHPLRVEDEHSFIRLVEGSSFAFQGKYGRLTLRKESRPHGRGEESYWYAYRHQGRRTLKKYVGRTADLTIARLEDIAEALAAEATSSANERSRAKGGVVPEPQVESPAEEMRAVLQGPVPGPVPTSPSGQRGQDGPLLAPKLRLPRLYASLVTRPRLLTRLDAGLEGKLTLLSAPAGFGKTTLVSQWIADRSTHQSDQHPLPPVAWVSLDSGDNDPVRFWRYVVTACQAFQAALGQTTLAVLHTALQPPLGLSLFEASLTIFLNELSQLPRRGILVLEDYHVITSPQIHEMVAFLLDHLPTTLHLIMITRIDPPFPLSPGVIKHLDAHLEGWVTGLRLVALTLQGRMTQQEVELEHVLATFSGDHRHLLEYFVTEVLNAQLEPLQVFLLHTSVLNRLTGSLCDAVTERNDSDGLLEAMERTGLFLIPLEGVGRWYRYHALFAEARGRG